MPLGLRLGTSLGAGGSSEPSNQLLYSEQFDNAVWVKEDSLITADNTTDPLGGATADRLIDNNAGGTGQVSARQPLAYAPTTNATFSIYCKADQVDWCEVVCTGAAANVSVYYNLATGTTGTIGNNAIATSITDAGSGWWRCSVSLAGDGTILIPRVYACAADRAPGPPIAEDLDGTTSIFIWGAQMSPGLAPEEYVQTTSSTIP